MPFDGGYYLINQPIMRRVIHQHTAADMACVSDEVLQAVNTIQETPWRVNAWVLDLMRDAWLSQSLLGGLPSPDDEKLPPKLDPEVWEAMSPKEQGAWKYELSKVHERNASLVGKREALLRKLRIAEELRRDDYIWFPHSLDFRSRIYPMPQDLNPQGDDISRSLLMFGQGKPLGESGLYWLAIRLANTFGEDKLTRDQQLAWVDEHRKLIIDCAEDPLDGSRFWCEADEPWSFLATCREYALAMKEKRPAEFVSHLPIPQDGTCNGLQHLSLMGRDRRGAIATNCSASKGRHDLYSEVAQVVSRLVNEDVIQGVPEALAWAAKGIDRNVVKRGVMTTPYGVTARGIRDQLIQDGHTEGLEGSKALAAQYLQKKISIAVAETVVSARDIMAYFQDTAVALAEREIPLRWKTPAGMEVIQSYYNLSRREVVTLNGRLILWNEDPTIGLNKRKQGLASAPNIIHSFDAAMLVLTANRCRERYGIVSFSFIHDSYGTHACDTTKLSKTLRDVAYEMYSVDRLAEFEEYVSNYAPDVKLPARPALGDFDVSEVLDAPYFFA